MVTILFWRPCPAALRAGFMLGAEPRKDEGQTWLGWFDWGEAVSRAFFSTNHQHGPGSGSDPSSVSQGTPRATALWGSDPRPDPDRAAGTCRLILPHSSLPLGLLGPWKGCGQSETIVASKASGHWALCGPLGCKNLPPLRNSCLLPFCVNSTCTALGWALRRL